MRDKIPHSFSEIERKTILQLYQEYQSILQHHRVRLKPAAISLFDSDSHWGKWDPETYTLYISRKLITQFSWFQVQGVLRHEMAHQLVSETTSVQDRPHGEIFQWACHRLGVTAEFSGASADLQEFNPDWKVQKRQPEEEKLLSKVEKLLALATSSNEHESLVAMNKVRELHAKYQLKMNLDVKASCFGSSGRDAQFGHLVVTHHKKRIEAHQKKIVGILVGHFFVRVLYCTTFHSKSGNSYQAFEIIGNRENVLMAEYVYYFLLNQLDYLVREAKDCGKLKSRLAHKSYRLGILEGFQKKLQEYDEQSIREYKSSSTVSSVALATIQSESFVPSLGQALVLLKKDENLDAYLKKSYPRITSLGSATQMILPSVYSEGEVAGRKITLNKAVTTQMGIRGYFLTNK